MGSILEFMGQDHDILDAIFTDFHRESNAGKARELFSRFEAGLRTHIAWEEEIIFPAFEAKTGMIDSGPTVVMRMEHEEIKRELQAIRERIGKPDMPHVARVLVDVLTLHNQKEESVLYPWLDRSLPEPEVLVLLNRIRASYVEPAPGTKGR